MCIRDRIKQMINSLSQDLMRKIQEETNMIEAEILTKNDDLVEIEIEKASRPIVHNYFTRERNIFTLDHNKFSLVQEAEFEKLVHDTISSPVPETSTQSSKSHFENVNSLDVNQIDRDLVSEETRVDELIRYEILDTYIRNPNDSRPSGLILE
eukprot:TRINITY_DN7983_c0_g1_i3.p1 TRINITY_DN7983_c0_g1~~TRINITY_DN7983_c0_g1_i3.p1  ORF type:complete len:153 (-),score=33.62 TRINITY_DN7983_c0_g1_i3:116-574(-)